METLELLHPQMEIQLGQYRFTEGISVETSSSQENYFDWARIRLAEQLRGRVELERRTPASVWMGYNGKLEKVFSGYTTAPIGGGTASEVVLKDKMLALEDTVINATFLETTPQEIITYFLAQAGVDAAVLSPQEYPERKQLPIRQMNGIDGIQAVNAAWNTKQRFFFREGTFYWGEKPPQEIQFCFEYGVNILGLEPSGKDWVLTTVCAPFIKHSDIIRVTHPKTSGEFEVKKVMTASCNPGFLRTTIHF